MKSLKLSLALALTLGLGSVALADHAGGCSPCAQADPCCGHGLLSKLKLHSCNSCCAEPKPCPAPCDPCAGGCGHKLFGMLKCIKLPKLGGHCCEVKRCEPKCEPKVCAPKCCNPCGGLHGLKGKLHGLFSHKNGCCEAPKPACDPCGGCGHKLSMHKLFGNKCCGGCEGAVIEAAPAAPAAAPAAPAPAPAPKPAGAGASNNGLLILTPAG